MKHGHSCGVKYDDPQLKIFNIGFIIFQYPLTTMHHLYLFILFIMKFVQLGTQIKTRSEKKKIYKNTQKVHYGGVAQW